MEEVFLEMKQFLACWYNPPEHSGLYTSLYYEICAPGLLHSVQW